MLSASHTSNEMFAALNKISVYLKIRVEDFHGMKEEDVSNFPVFSVKMSVGFAFP